MNKIHNLEIYKKTTSYQMWAKFLEEENELLKALDNRDNDNIIEELLDVIQCCYGLAYTLGINLEEHIRQHNKKLLSRGHKFID